MCELSSLLYVENMKEEYSRNLIFIQGQKSINPSIHLSLPCLSFYSVSVCWCFLVLPLIIKMAPAGASHTACTTQRVV